MADLIFVVDPESKEPIRVEPVSFSEIGIKERENLEQWVINHPELLGERLLVITSEFDRFDKSTRRLDILALDLEGTHTVIELKLDVSRSLADLQAIRYAAFCSTMTMDNLIEMLANFEDLTKEEASRKICGFLKVNDLPELDNRPRIILAAGSIDDQEMTSSVLWLRSFGIEISCVELTPYCIPRSTQIILVPRIIIPIPEAREYIISMQKKEVAKINLDKDKLGYQKLWQAVAEEFNKLGLRFQASGKSSSQTQQILFGDSRVHYEWLIRKRDSRLDIGLHFESKDLQENLSFLELIKAHEAEIKQNIDLEFRAEPWGKKWALFEFRLPYIGDIPSKEIAPEAANIMKILIERTWPLIESHVNKRAEYRTHS